MSKKHFTFRVFCSFEMQFTFTESDVEQSDEGADGDMEPTDEALESLREEIEEALGERYAGVRVTDVSPDGFVHLSDAWED